ncbi:CDCA3 protein, partial [Syrrhaptes paradoxus]|nr:CDCA3 protein [Syrrhaptes paradoxus]
MGASGSAPATPRNKHLAHVSDPRSPSAGILRTPIEVVSSLAGSPSPCPAQLVTGTSQDRDPRSPTPGISRTPMRATPSDSVDRLVQQLSEAFGAEAAPQEQVPPGVACPAEEPAQWNSPGGAASSGEEVEGPPSPSAGSARPAGVAGPGFSSGKCSMRETLICFLLSLGSKPVRRKTNNKILATSGRTGRSPLSILQDDNSSSVPAPRQGKRYVLGENLGEKEVTVDLSRSLKSGNCGWSNLNKENQQCPFVEN